jgi:hypothetical protein
MASFFERYQGGEHEQVWAELLALGDQVRAEPLYSDARAVARETMRRVRRNIEALIPRLESIGYKFGYDWLQEHDQNFAKGQPPVFAAPNPNAQEHIAELERLVGVLPLSLHAWYGAVGAVNFVGAAPEYWQVNAQADPLYIYPIQAALEEYTDWRESRREAEDEMDVRPNRVPIAPDYLHKYNISGGMWYNIVLPNAAVDAQLADEWHHTTFVNYLRICFRWAGLPGLERVPKPPTKELAYLTKDLLPI